MPPFVGVGSKHVNLGSSESDDASTPEDSDFETNGKGPLPVSGDATMSKRHADASPTQPDSPAGVSSQKTRQSPSQLFGL